MRLLTPAEAADLARVSRSMIYSWCDERRLAHIRAGGTGKRGRILIAEDDLDDLLKSLRVAATGCEEGADGPPSPLKHIRLS